MELECFSVLHHLAWHYQFYSPVPRKRKYCNNFEKSCKKGWYWKVIRYPGSPVLLLIWSSWWSWNNSGFSGPWFHIMPTALPGNPAGSHHTGYWPSGDSRTENTTYNVAATTSFSNLGGFLRDPDQSTDQISSAWHFCLDELTALGGMAPSHHFHYAVISFLHRFCIISMVESLFTLIQIIVLK